MVMVQYSGWGSQQHEQKIMKTEWFYNYAESYWCLGTIYRKEGLKGITTNLDVFAVRAKNLWSNSASKSAIKAKIVGK